MSLIKKITYCFVYENNKVRVDSSKREVTLEILLVTMVTIFHFVFCKSESVIFLSPLLFLSYWQKLKVFFFSIKKSSTNKQLSDFMPLIAPSIGNNCYSQKLMKKTETYLRGDCSNKKAVHCITVRNKKSDCEVFCLSFQ